MPKKTETTETTKEALQEAETTKEALQEEQGDTVTVSAAEFNEMKEQLKLLSKLMTSENRLKSREAKRAEEEEKLMEQVRKSNEGAMELVKIHVDRGNLKGNRNAEVAINGVQYTIPKGKDVMVPRCVAEVLENAERQRNAAYALQEEKSAEYETAKASGAFDGITVNPT